MLTHYRLDYRLLTPDYRLLMSHTVITFGEIMLRLSPPGFERFFQSPALSAIFGGGEANVAASLAHFGLTAATSRACRRTRSASRRAGAARGGDRHDPRVRGGDRVGIYFAETGASQRASTVVYDRAHSSISEIGSGAVPWDAVMQGAAWFHVTGITPALGENARRRPRRDRRGASGRAPASASTSTTARSCGPRRRRRRRCGR